MKMHSSEQFGSGEPQQPLQVDSAPENRPNRSKKRRSRAKKAASAAKVTPEFKAVETEVRQNEVRLIWNRGGDVVLEPQPAKNKKAVSEARPAAKKRPPAPKLEADAGSAPKTAAPAETAPRPQVQPETPHSKAAQEDGSKSTPEAFHALLDELAAGRTADEARREPDGKASATETSPQPETAANNTEALFGSPPPLPPEPTSYRHFFWNEHTITSPAEAMAERTMLPTVDHLEAPASSSGQERSYVEGQTVAAAAARERGQADYRETPGQVTAAEAAARPGQSAEINTPPPLEAVPLHNAGELQFPDRRPGMRTAPGEAFANAIPGVNPDARPAAQGPHEQLDAAELKKLADTIKVDGISLSEMLAAKRIDEAGLRAVVQTFLRGGDVRKQLMQEIVDYEKSFERDPAVRRQRSGQMRAALATTSAKVAQKSYALTKTSQKATQHAARALKGAAQHAGHELRGSGIAERIPSLAAIVVIYTLIIILLLT